MKLYALGILLTATTSLLAPTLARANTSTLSKAQITFTVTNQKCTFSSSQVGLGDVVRFQLLSIQPNGQAVPFKDSSLNVIWSVDSQATPYYPATKWSDIFPVNSPIEFGMSRGDDFVGATITISATEATVGANASVSFTLVKSSLANCK